MISFHTLSDIISIGAFPFFCCSLAILANKSRRRSYLFNFRISSNYLLRLKRREYTPYYSERRTEKKYIQNIVGSDGLTTSKTKRSQRSPHERETQYGFGVSTLEPVHYAFNKELGKYDSALGAEKFEPITTFTTVQQNNEIIVAFLGKWNKAFVLCRLNTDCSIDTSFGKNGIIDTNIVYSEHKNSERLFRLSVMSEQEREEFLVTEQLNNFVTIDHRTDDIIFKYHDNIKKYDRNGQNIAYDKRVM